MNLLAPKQKRHLLENWDRVIRSNLTATFLLSSHVAEAMATSRTKGVIINFSSVSAAGNPGQSAYAAAKAGIEALTSVWAKELGPLGVRVVTIAPGFVDTPSTRTALPDDSLKEWARRTPLRRLAKADEIAGAVMFAIENDYLTGPYGGHRWRAHVMSAAGKQRLVIFGAGKVTEVIYRHLRHAGNYDVVAFTCELSVRTTKRDLPGFTCSAV